MEKLWAPWRANYILAKHGRRCPFCNKQKSKKDKTNYVIARGKHVFSILNLFPYNNGHIMVAPYRHVRDITELEDRELLEMIKFTKESQRLLSKVLKPEGYNIGMNLGKVAGAGIAGHVHLHIVPRWTGDTNFMPVLSGTKIISQSLDSLYEKLKANVGKEE